MEGVGRARPCGRRDGAAPQTRDAGGSSRSLRRALLPVHRLAGGTELSRPATLLRPLETWFCGFSEVLQVLAIYGRNTGTC